VSRRDVGQDLVVDAPPLSAHLLHGQAIGIPNRSASRVTARGGADLTSSGTNPSHGSVHSCTARPRRSAGPRPRPGLMNSTSAGVRVKKRISSSRFNAGNERSRSKSSSVNTRVVTTRQPALSPTKPPCAESARASRRARADRR
jgi:hypothetical protein